MPEKRLPRPVAPSDELLRRLRMRHFQLLALLDERGSLTEVADVLSLTQPAVSKMLIEVEQVFGTPLFERGRRGVRPTASGEAAIRRARTLLGEMTLLADEVRVVNEGGQALLQIGTFSITQVVPRAIVTFTRRVPGVRIRIKEGPISDLLARLLDGELDCVFAAISPESLGAGDASRLSWQSVTEDHLCALLAETNPLASADTLRWRDCADARWVTMPADTVVRQRFMEAFVREGIDPPLPVIETMSPVTIAALVREDPNLIGLCRFEVSGQNALLPGLRRLSLSPKMNLPPMCLITRRAEIEPPLVSRFADCVRQATATGVNSV